MLVVLTGATSGVGEQAALQLAERGATVVPVGRDPGRLEKVAAALRERGSDVDPLRADFASQAEVRRAPRRASSPSRAGVRRLAGELLHRHDRIDVLVNNAGVVTSSRSLSPDGREL